MRRCLLRRPLAIVTPAQLENAVWSYEDPLPEVTEIAGHLAFYLDKVEEIRLSEL